MDKKKRGKSKGPMRFDEFDEMAVMDLASDSSKIKSKR